MKLLSRLLLLCLSLSLLAACEPRATQQETTALPSTPQALDTDTSIESRVELGGISVANRLPGTVAKAQRVAATPPDPSTPTGDALPEHLLFEFQPYYPEVFQESQGFTLPQIAVYSRNQFAEYGFDQEANALDTLLANRPNLATQETLPYLPSVAGDQLFHAAAKYLEFEGGTGISYITAYGLDVSPLTEERVFYTFQGLTKDGRYISATFPIKTGFFSEPKPLEGAEYDAFADRYQEYLAETRDRINAANPTTEFAPPITQLDTVIQSIRVN